MPVTRASMAAAIQAKLDGYFALTSGNVRPDFSTFLAATICDAVQDAVNSYTVPVSTPTLLDSLSGTVTGTVTTTLTCTIP